MRNVLKSDRVNVRGFSFEGITNNPTPQKKTCLCLFFSNSNISNNACFVKFPINKVHSPLHGNSYSVTSMLSITSFLPLTFFTKTNSSSSNVKLV